MDRGTRPPEIHYSPEEKDVYYTTAAASAFAVQMSRNHKRDREPAKRHAKRTHNVMRWRTGDMVQRWVASAWLHTEKHFRKVVGHRDLWALALVSGRERKPKAPSVTSVWRSLMVVQLIFVPCGVTASHCTVIASNE